MQKFNIFYEGDESRFQKHEKRAAKILAEHFQSDIVLQKTHPAKTADLYVTKSRSIWEIKSPIGDGKRTIDNNLRSAAKQSANIVLDLGRCKTTDEKSISRARDFLRREHHSIKKVKIIRKSKSIIDIFW